MTGSLPQLGAVQLGLVPFDEFFADLVRDFFLVFAFLGQLVITQCVPDDLLGLPTTTFSQVAGDSVGSSGSPMA